MGKKTGTAKKTDTPLYSRDGPVVSYKRTASHSTGLRQVTHPLQEWCHHPQTASPGAVHLPPSVEVVSTVWTRGSGKWPVSMKENP